MKKIILAVTALALVGTQVQRAEAHGGFGIVAGVAGGLVAGTIIGESIAQPPAYYAPAPAPAVVYRTAPAVVYAPAPAVYVAPPVVSFGFGFGRPYYYRGHYYRHW